MERQNLSAMLKATGLSQQKFGDVFGYSMFQISNYITGKTAVPTDLVNKLSKALNVKPDDFRKKNLNPIIKDMVLVINTEGVSEVDALKKEIEQLKDIIISLQAQLISKK